MSKKLLTKNTLSITKNFVLLYRLSISAILLTGCFFIKFSLDQEKVKVEEKILVAADQIERSIAYNVEYLKYQLFYSTQQIREKRAFEDNKRMEKILSSFVNNINNQVDISITWNAFSWIDHSNKMSVDGSGGIIRSPVDVSDRDYLKITTQTPNKLVFGEVVIGALSGRNIIPVAMGTFSDNHQYLGTLVFGLDIERILARLEKIISNDSISFAVVNSKGIVMNSSNFDEENSHLVSEITKKNVGYKSSADVRKIISSQDLPFRFTKKGTGFVCFKNIKNSPFGVLVFYDKDKSYEQLYTTFLQQLLFVLLVISAAILLFQRIYKRVVEPVSKLSQFAVRISQKDFSYSLEKPKNIEMIDLYHALSLVKQVLEREESLLRKLEIANIEISKANQAKTEFLARSSHDIKNYVFGICGLATMLLDEKCKSDFSDDDMQIVQTISNQSEELMHFVEDLLDTAQAESGEFGIGKFKDCDIATLIDRIVLLNKSFAIRHHITLKTVVENDLPMLTCDERRMKQILINLISNAIKYSHERTTVIISAGLLPDKKQIYIEVQDNGIGMTKEEIDMALNGKGKSINKSGLGRSFDSHGVGIPIVAKLVELHHGKIEFDSQKGFGTKVRILFNLFNPVNEPR